MEASAPATLAYILLVDRRDRDILDQKTIKQGHNEIMSQAYITNNKHTQEKWNELVEALQERRFFLKKNIDLFEYFIKDVNKIEINEKDVFYRARRGNYSDDNKLNAPSADEIKSGRLNPPGIPYLYIGDSENTVVSEVRPWIGSEVTLVKFQPVTHLSVADFVAFLLVI